MEYPAALQIAVFIASLAIIAMAVVLIPMAIMGVVKLMHLAHVADRLNENAQALLKDGRDLIRNVNDLATQANRQMENVASVMETVKRWTKRADQLVNAAGSVVEPPVFAMARNMNLLRTGVKAFLLTLLSSSPIKPIREEKDHV